MELSRVSIRKISTPLAFARFITPRVKQVEQSVRKADQEESKDQEEPDDPSCNIKDDVDDNSELLNDSKLEQLYVIISMDYHTNWFMLIIGHSAVRTQ